MIPSLLALLACAAPGPTENPFADRPVRRPAACVEGPAKHLSVTLGAVAARPSSIRVGWRPSATGPWSEIGRVEGGAAELDLPGGGEVALLGIGTPSCVARSGDAGSPVSRGFLHPRGNDWRCARDVRVIDARGSPVAGAEVWVATGDEVRLSGALVGWSGADGWARGVPAPCTSATMGAASAGLGVWGSPTEDTVTTVALPEATARLQGRVRSGDTPVAGARVGLIREDRPELPDLPMAAVSVWTDADGRWSADLALPVDHDDVRLRVEAEGFVREVATLPVRAGQDRSKFVDLAPARQVHLRCIGGPEDSCDDGGYRSVRCGPPGDLDPAIAIPSADRGPRQLSVVCPDVPDLRVSLDSVESVVYDDVAWFDAP